ncbi:hypothetical protein HYZ64_03285 [Candidatus Berkelbacteria bacterium]|nr:hypothetical protein [Candidatus Berkelbacteria bacterium]
MTNQDNAFPLLLRLGTPGNSTSPTGEADVTTSGPIEYTSPDLSPIFKKKYLTLGDYLTDLVKVAMVLSVVGATLVVVYAGFDYLNSGGSPEGTAHAKEMIAGALLGIATVFMMSAFLVSLYDKETLKNLSPPATGQTTDQKQLLTTKLNTKLEQLKSLAQTAGVTLTPAQEQKIKSAIGTSANAGKPDAVKKAVREVADEIAKQKPQFKSIIDQQIGAVQKEIDKIFTENTVLSSQNQLQDNQTKITRITAPDCPTTTKGIEGIIRLEGCKAANQVVGELRLRPKKETCDKELFTNFALKANQYNPTDQQSSFNNFNDGFIEQCKKIRGTS